MKARLAETRAGYLFAAPWVIGFFVFMAYPVAASIYYSFCDYSVLRPPIFIGFDNYRDLWHDKIFWTGLYNTAFYTALALPLGTIFAIVLALLLNAKVRGQAFYRTIFYLPSLLPLVALACLWLWMFNGDHGIVNIGLEKLPLPGVNWSTFHLFSGHVIHLPIPALRHVAGPPWLGDPDWTKPALVLMSLWGAGNAMVIYLAGLQDVPVELLEASDLDGARPLDKLRHVTIPMISPVILFNVVMGLISCLQIFVVPYVMFPAPGQPAHSTYFYVSYLYDNAFIFHKMGYACAMGWILFVIIFVLTLGSIKFSEKKVYYGGG